MKAKTKRRLGGAGLVSFVSGFLVQSGVWRLMDEGNLAFEWRMIPESIVLSVVVIAILGVMCLPIYGMICLIISEDES